MSTAYITRQDLEQFATKEDLANLAGRLETLGGHVKDIQEDVKAIKRHLIG